MNIRLVVYLVLVLLFLLLASCQVILKHSDNFDTALDKSVLPDSIRITVEALDLTEDMSPVSSNNDEILVFIHTVNDSINRVTLLHSESFTVKNRNFIRNFSFKYQRQFVDERLSICLVERDSDQLEPVIEQIFRSNYFRITTLFQKQGNYGTESIIDDNDIIGIKTISNPYKGMREGFKFSGVYKLDKFSYNLNLVMF